MWPSPEAQEGTQGRRVPRRKFDAHVAALEEQRDRAIGQKRAHHDWVTRWLEGRADSYRLDAAAQERVTDSAMPKSTLTPKERRVVADTLSELAQDIERGTT